MTTNVQLTSRSRNKLYDDMQAVRCWALDAEADFLAGTFDADEMIQRLNVMTTVTKRINTTVKARRREAAAKARQAFLAAQADAAEVAS